VVLAILAGGLVIYLGAFALCRWVFADPAANMAYFVYDDRRPLVDRTAFHLFYPVYRCSVWLGAARHNRDRPAVDHTGMGP